MFVPYESARSRRRATHWVHTQESRCYRGFPSCEQVRGVVSLPRTATAGARSMSRTAADTRWTDVTRHRWIMWVVLLALLLVARSALAVPSFARQTGMACEACHTVYPELTHFGRMFKANGYVLNNIKQVQDVGSRREQLLELAQIPPLSIMAQISYTQLKTPLPDLTNVDIPGEAQNGSVGFP